MMNILKYQFILIFLMIISSCSNHHPAEGIVKKILIEPENINTIIKNHKNTKFYYNSIVEKNEINLYDTYGDYIKKYKDGYFIISYGSWFDKKYYYEVDREENSDIMEVITVKKTEEDPESFSFSFTKKDGEWQLMGMGFKTDLDISVD